MREWTTRVPTFQAPSAQPTQAEAPRQYQTVTQPAVQPTYQPVQSQQPKAPVRPQPQVQQWQQQAQQAKSPLATTFMPRSEVLKGKRNNPKGKGLSLSPSLDRSAIRPNTFAGGRNFTPTTGAGAYDTKGFGTSNINKIPAPVSFNGIGYNPITNPSGTNAPSMNTDDPWWWAVNGDLDIPDMDRSGSYVSDAPEGGYSTENPYQGFDYMGRPLGYGGQVIWDEQGNVIPEVASQYESMGMNLPSPFSNDSGFEIDRHLGTGRPQASAPSTQSFMGGGRPPYVPTGNLASGNTSSNSGQIEKTIRYITDLGFDPLEVVQNPALMNMLFNQFMY